MAYCEALHKKNNKKDKSSQTAIHSCFSKKVFVKTSQNSQENTCAEVFVSINLQLYLERGSGAGVFQKVFGKF